MYDLIIIGAGPAGYTAALLAAKEKLKVALIEKDIDNIGGVCLNEGCIPLKGFIYYSKNEKNYGLIRDKVLDKIKILRNGLKSRLLNSGVDIINSKAVLKSKNEVLAGDKVFKAKNIIIATGSVSKKIFNKSNVLTSERAFNIKDDFEKVLIIGAGAVGLEYASFFNNLGKNVTLVEVAPFILPFFDKETVNYYLRELNKKKIRLLLESKVNDISEKNEVSIITRSENIKEKFNVIIETTGRNPATSELGCNDIKIDIDEKGFIKVNENYQTTVESIYAAGDCINTPMLAYTASKEAEIIVKHILTGKAEKINYDKIPKIVFSIPQIGCTGNINMDDNTKIYKYFFKANGKAFIEEKEVGFIKLFVDNKENIIKGASVFGDEITELLNELTIIIENKINIEAIKENIFIHPSYSEIISDALNYG